MMRQPCLYSPEGRKAVLSENNVTIGFLDDFTLPFGGWGELQKGAHNCYQTE
jgi:hypothetical protein